MRKLLAALLIVGIGAAVIPLNAGTTTPPQLTITPPGEKPKTVSIFDKWADGATLALGDLGADGVKEIVVGAGPGSKPDIGIFREDGSFIKGVTVFDKSFKGGVVVSVGDVDGDGVNEIIAAAGPGGGPHVRILDGEANVKYDFFPFDASFHGGVTATASGGKLVATQLVNPAPLTRTFTLVGGAFVTVTESTGVALAAQSESTMLTDNGTLFSVPAPHFTNGKFDVHKYIEVNLATQRLFAYEDGYLVDTFLVSTGNKKYPTPPGNYAIRKKIPLMDYRWSYGPHHPDNYFLPHVHWNSQFMTHAYIHEAYWHNAFGTVRSHGCINARKDDAKFIFDWSDIGTPVIVHT